MDQHDPAARRFWLMQLARLSGAGLALLGALIIAGKVEQSQAVGVALVVIGAVDFFAVPAMLAKRWKSGE